MHLRRLLPLVAVATSCAHTTTAPKTAAAVAQPPTDGKPVLAGLHFPIQSFTLDNGLRVVLVPDHASPTVAVGVYYHIGFRIEPRDRTGFAHLFEHMMFQGSQNLGKMGFLKLGHR